MFWRIQEILYLIGTKIFPFGQKRDKKIGFKDFNFALKIIENTGIAMNGDKYLIDCRGHQEWTKDKTIFFKNIPDSRIGLFLGMESGGDAKFYSPGSKILHHRLTPYPEITLFCYPEYFFKISWIFAKAKTKAVRWKALPFLIITPQDSHIFKRMVMC